MPKDVFEELHDLVQASLKPPPSRAKWMVPVASSLAGIVVGKKFVFVNDIARRVGENCTITLRHPAARASGDENWLIVQADTEQAAEDAVQAVERRIGEVEATMQAHPRCQRNLSPKNTRASHISEGFKAGDRVEALYREGSRGWKPAKVPYFSSLVCIISALVCIVSALVHRWSRSMAAAIVEAIYASCLTGSATARSSLTTHLESDLRSHRGTLSVLRAQHPARINGPGHRSAHAHHSAAAGYRRHERRHRRRIRARGRHAVRQPAVPLAPPMRRRNRTCCRRHHRGRRCGRFSQRSLWVP